MLTFRPTATMVLAIFASTALLCSQSTSAQLAQEDPDDYYYYYFETKQEAKKRLRQQKKTQGDLEESSVDMEGSEDTNATIIIAISATALIASLTIGVGAILYRRKQEAAYSKQAQLARKAYIKKKRANKQTADKLQWDDAEEQLEEGVDDLTNLENNLYDDDTTVDDIPEDTGVTVLQMLGLDPARLEITKAIESPRASPRASPRGSPRASPRPKRKSIAAPMQEDPIVNKEQPALEKNEEPVVYSVASNQMSKFPPPLTSSPGVENTEPTIEQTCVTVEATTELVNESSTDPTDNAGPVEL